ncbi:hypothetical protein PT974_04953 [Cladobotryum mycophilum]|uniref:Insecticidal crystal toxin domain-containing protein n=1 Tax=Cladobotryum mycophilum TaxID=491253 RepID=A0ABR0SQS9_9HYPO
MKPISISQFFFFISPFITVNASPHKRALKSHIYDELSIAVTNEYELVTNDRGGESKRSIGLWHPKPNGEFRPLGAIAINSNRDDPNGKRATMLVAMSPGEKKDPPALKEPEDWELIWSDEGGNADKNTAIWMPKAPDGYVAMGHSVTNGNRAKPSNDIIWCVRKDLAKRGMYNDATIWDNRGVTSEEDTATWEVIPAPNDDDEDDKSAQFFPLYAGTFLYSKGYNRPTTPSWLLTIKLPSNYVNFTAEAPKVKAGHIPPVDKVFNKIKQANVTLPLTSMFAPNEARIMEEINDPFYTISKSVGWLVKNVLINDQSGTLNHTDTVEYGISSEQSKTFEHTAGVSITATTGITTGFSSAEFSVSLNYQFTASSSSSFGEYVHKTTTDSLDIQDRATIVLFRKREVIKVTRTDGSLIKREVIMANEAAVIRQVEEA